MKAIPQDSKRRGVRPCACAVNAAAVRKSESVSFPALPGIGRPQASGFLSQASEVHRFVVSLLVSLFPTVHTFVYQCCSLSPTGFSFPLLLSLSYLGSH